MDGILVVNKPLGKTSFDMVAQTRREFHTKKVGHIGTLDPMASGVLPILIGSCTKLSDYLMDHDKDYVAIIKLGKSTNTGDQEGEIVEEAEVDKSILE
jgi:tRNA pseudouridine55 synthase